jgi:hypothetical protein
MFYNELVLMIINFSVLTILLKKGQIFWIGPNVSSNVLQTPHPKYGPYTLYWVL